MGKVRSPYQGVLNIVRFNWHFYLIASIIIVVAFVLLPYLSTSQRSIAILGLGLMIFAILFSLLISYYVYDVAGLYKLDWLKDVQCEKERIVNINAGFDETSELINEVLEYPDLMILDFYNSSKHTEISIKRAREYYPPMKGTLTVDSDDIPIESASVDIIIGFLSLHEIRQERERIVLFKELKRILNRDGRLFVVEHLRDLPNFLAYNIGFFHFHSKRNWITTFELAGFKINKEEKITPFISKFELIHGSSS